MGPGNLGHRLHCFHPQDAQVGLPAVEPEERIMISTEPRGQTLPGDGLVEHAAERGTVDCHGLHAKADDPPAKLIHDDQNPVPPQQDRFEPEQIQAPETVLGMTQERKPRRSEVTAFGAVVCGQNSTHHIFVEVDTKGLGQVLRYDAPFHFGNRQASGNLEKMSACKRAGPPLRWRKRFWNLRVVARLRGLSLRHSSSQTCAKLTTTRRNRLSAKAALELWTRLRSSPSVTSRA